MRVILIGADDSLSMVALTDSLRAKVLVDLTILAEQYRDAGWDLRRPEEALEEFADESYALLVLPGDRFVMATAGFSWFARDHVISEEWIGHGVTVEEAVHALRLVGRRIGATKLEVGTRATPGQRHEAAARLYQRQGLRLSTNVLVGETHG